jgi:hypothetical protein
MGSLTYHKFKTFAAIYLHGRKGKKIRKLIVDLLKSKTLYEIGDEILIDELLFLQSMIVERRNRSKRMAY